MVSQHIHANSNGRAERVVFAYPRFIESELVHVLEQLKISVMNVTFSSCTILTLEK